ncbi:MAG: hypothetical protein CSA76_01925 [Spirochaetales bacterium]|nr:MAG: hypothetical protein CSA76_01925 [Spirochaetales bacterium]
MLFGRTCRGGKRCGCRRQVKREKPLLQISGGTRKVLDVVEKGYGFRPAGRLSNPGEKWF